MTYSKLARPALALLAVATIGACSKKPEASSTAPAPANRPAATVAARPFTAAQATLGDSLFHGRSCQNCHGPDAKGRTNGPNLTTGKFMHVNGTYEDFVRIITTGVPADQIKDPSHRLAMAPRGGQRPAPLTDDQIKAIAAYVYTLNHP